MRHCNHVLPHILLTLLCVPAARGAAQPPADSRPAPARPQTAQATASQPATAGTVRSKDGTAIAFTRTGTGPVVILVSGALSDRSMHSGLPALLAERCQVIAYDRRGRGQSGDTQPYAVEREVEDIEALIDAAGGTANLYGISSGAVLALEAGNRLAAKIAKLALYEPPFVVDDSRPPVPADFVAKVRELVARGHRGDAIAWFMTAGVGVPEGAVAQMRRAPMWPGLERLAHTLAYDGLVMSATQAGKPLPADRWTKVTMPTLVLAGGKTDAWLLRAADALAGVLGKDAHRRDLPGQTHMVAPAAIAPVLAEFFTGAAKPAGRQR